MAEQTYTPLDVGATREARAAMDETLWWKPKAGENRWKDNFVRLLPPHRSMEGKLWWGVPLHFSVGPGGSIIPCPRKAFAQQCPVCDVGFALLNEGRREDGLDMLPTWAGYINVVPLNEDGTPEGDNPKVRVLSASRGVIDDLLDILETLGDITDLEKGRDINIRRRGSGKKSTKYQTTAATAPSPFDYPDLVDGMHDLTMISPYWEIPKMIEAMQETGDPLATAAAEPKTSNPALPPAPDPAPTAPRFAPPPDDDEGHPEDEDPKEEGEPTPQQSDDDRNAAQERLKAQISQSPKEPTGKKRSTRKPKAAEQ